MQVVIYNQVYMTFDILMKVTHFPYFFFLINTSTLFSDCFRAGLECTPFEIFPQVYM